MVASAGSKEEEPWYDVDIVKGTLYTVTGYHVPKDTATIVEVLDTQC